MLTSLLFSFFMSLASAETAAGATVTEKSATAPTESKTKAAPAAKTSEAAKNPAPPKSSSTSSAKPKAKKSLKKPVKVVAQPEPPDPAVVPEPDPEPEIDFDDKATPDQPNRPEAKDGPFFGVTFGTGWIQDYPGAADGRQRYLAIPSYKSKHLTIDRQDGVKGDLVERERFQFSVSFSFLFPTESKKIPIRAGMPDLDWTLQLGPELRVELFHNDFHTMYLRLPVRFVANTDFAHHFDYLDWNFAPSFRNVFDLGEGVGEIVTRLELDYSSEKYSDLFYEVAPQYATATRPAYDAKAGLMEYIAGLNYSYYDFFPWTFFVGGNVYFLQDAVNRDSPLVLKKTNYSFFGGIVRYF